MKAHEALSDALGVEYKPETLPVKVEASAVVVNDNTEPSQDQNEDYALSRRTFKNLIKKGEEAIEELRQEASDDALGVYGNDDNEEEGDLATPESGEEEEGEYTDPVLKKLLGGEKEEDEGPQETGDLKNMSVAELTKLMQSAIDDEDYEFASQIRDILKNIESRSDYKKVA